LLAADELENRHKFTEFLSRFKPEYREEELEQLINC